MSSLSNVTFSFFFPGLETDRLGGVYRYEGKDIAVPCGADGLGDIARVMLREIVGRQNGTIKSDWSVPV